jgi:thioredoxin 1
MMKESVISVTAETFDSEVRQAEAALVDFWGPRCAPCLALMPHVEKLAEAYSERIRVLKVNAQENRQLCIQLKVMSLPTFIFFANGQEVGRISGEIKADELRSWVDEKLLQVNRTCEPKGDREEWS